MNSDKPSESPQPPTPPTALNNSLASYRLTPSETALLRQGKKAITDYVQAELPARLAQLNLAGTPNKP